MRIENGSAFHQKSILKMVNLMMPSVKIQIVMLLLPLRKEGIQNCLRTVTVRRFQGQFSPKKRLIKLMDLQRKLVSRCKKNT